MEKRLYKNEYNRMIGGVCSGLADYFDMDPTVVRLIFAIAFFTWGVGLGVYVILWIVLPRKTFGPFTNPSDPNTVNYIVPPVSQFQTSQPFAPIPPKRQNNTAGVVVGAVLIFFGVIALLHQFNYFFVWHLHHWFFPVILVALGISLIIKGQQKHPWEHAGWHENAKKHDPEPTKDDTSATTTNPTSEL